MQQSIEELIKNRRSIKKFQDREIDLEEILELLEIAKWAPNHKLTEPWRFLLYSGAGKEHFIEAFCASQGKGEEAAARAAKKASYFRSIPIHLVVVMPEDPRQKTWDEDYGAVSALIQNFQLAAWAHGIGMIWRTNDWIYNPIFREKIGVKPGEKVVGTLMIGYPAEIPAMQPRTSIKDKISVITE